MEGAGSVGRGGLPAMVDAALAATPNPRAWPEPLRALWREAVALRQSAELEFQLKLGTLLAIATFLVDLVAIPSLAAVSLLVRMATVVPLNIAGLVMLRRGHRQAAKGATSLAIATFGASAIWFSAHGGSDLIARYSMATVLVLVLSLYSLPFSTTEKIRHALLFCVATALAGLVPAPAVVPPALLLQHIMLSVIAGAAMLALLRRVLHLEQREFLRSLQERFVREQLEQRNDELRELSESDPLTGLANRRSLERAFDRLSGTSAEQPVALMMIDLDHFKQFNDDYGHLAGDACLVEAARLLERVLGDAGGHVARFGGEEFVAIVAETRPGEGAAIAERLRAELPGLAIMAGPLRTRGITTSIGVARSHRGESMDDLIARADKALYRAKEQGRSRVELAPPFASLEGGVSRARGRRRGGSGAIAA